MSLLRSAYAGISWVGSPIISAYLKWRASQGYEDKNRLNERLGVSKTSRPNASLVWINAVSVGEAIAALTIIQAIQKKFPEVHFLLTTTTVSSENVVAKRLPKNTKHQFCPVDTPQSVHRFLNHWQPDIAIWIESELWPNLIYQTQERGIPTILLNGRMSPNSFANWKKMKGIIYPLLSKLNICAVQSDTQANYFKELGAQNIAVMGNVKIMMTPLTINLKEYEALKASTKNRPIWLAASTHPGEDEIILKAHQMLKQQHPTLLTIIVPRHIERASDIMTLGSQERISMALRTETSSLEEVEVYIGNTLGEMSLYYALSSVVFMGATLVPKGGHNPIEAAQLGSFILHGPHIFKNPQLYETLSSLGLSQSIQNDNELHQHILPWLTKNKENHDEPAPLKTYREKGLKDLIKILDPHLNDLREAWT